MGLIVISVVFKLVPSLFSRLAIGALATGAVLYVRGTRWEVGISGLGLHNGGQVVIVCAVVVFVLAFVVG